MLRYFKRRKCVHEYVLADYRRYVDLDYGIVREYVLVCRKCQKRGTASPRGYDELKELGFIYEREACR